MMNDGKLKIYRKIPTQSAGGKPTEVLELYTTAFYGELSFTTAEYYEAKQAETEIVKKVRIHQDKTVCNKHVIIVDGTQYDVGRTFSTDVKGIAITDITLERVTTQYDIV
jgi:SPP1 family predicted phage head-tail adaptor